MRSKVLVIVMMFCVALFSLGCGSSGGSDAGPGTVTTPTLSGSLSVPPADVASSLTASVRPQVVTYTNLKATAYSMTKGQLGNSVSMTDKTFKITLPSSDSGVYVRITGGTAGAFEMSRYFGTVSGDSAGDIDATTTCQLILYKDFSLATDTSSPGFSALFTDLMSYLKTPPTVASGKTIVDNLKTAQSNFISNYQAYQTTIKERFALIEAAIKAKDIDTTVSYFSPNFSSSNSALTEVTKENFKTVTADRFTRYTINTYTFNVEKITFPTSDTAVVYGNASISVTGIADKSTITTAVKDLKVVWRLESAKWMVYQDFPYLKSQLGY